MEHLSHVDWCPETRDGVNWNAEYPESNFLQPQQPTPLACSTIIPNFPLSRIAAAGTERKGMKNLMAIKHVSQNKTTFPLPLSCQVHILHFYHQKLLTLYTFSLTFSIPILSSQGGALYCSNPGLIPGFATPDLLTFKCSFLHVGDIIDGNEFQGIVEGGHYHITLWEAPRCCFG